MDLAAVFSRFSALLSERFDASVFTTEDSVRYTFSTALLESGSFHHAEIILELPHPDIPKAEVDLLIKPRDERPDSAFEFKYDRPIPSERNAPRTQKAGSVFKDLFRLARIPAETASERFFVYVAGHEMADYLRNPANGLNAFFELREGKSISLTSEFIESKAETFRTVIGNLFIPTTVTCVFTGNVSGNHALRIYRVEP